MFRLVFSRRWWWTTLLVLAGTAVLIRLGFWQLDRYAQNRAFNAHLEAMQAAAPLDLGAPTIPPDLTEMEYRTVKVEGSFDYDHQVAIRNQVWVQSWGNDSGYALLTPLVLPDGRAVLVERGWIPLQDNSAASWRQYDEPGPLTVTGVVRLPATPQMGGGVPDPTLAPGQTSLQFWNLVNIDRLQKQIPHPLLDIYLEQSPDPSQSGLPYRDSPVPGLADDGSNLGYALVWFSFAALLFIGYPIYLRRTA